MFLCTFDIWNSFIRGKQMVLRVSYFMNSEFEWPTRNDIYFFFIFFSFILSVQIYIISNVRYFIIGSG